jgi:DNA-binding transcriptional regulator GbsR (MarR family)
MTGKANFSSEEWETVLKGPPSAGMIVITAQRGGTFRESFSMAKSYGEARKQHGESELLDEIASTKPEIDRTRYHSPEELKEHGLQHLREAVELLERKATPEDVDEYRRSVLTLANRVADAHKEGFLGLSGERVSEAERAAVAEIAEALGTESP